MPQGARDAGATETLDTVVRLAGRFRPGGTTSASGIRDLTAAPGHFP